VRPAIGAATDEGDLLVVPDARHALLAIAHAVVLLTVGKAAQARHR
jgi:hypothetical protein